MQTTARTIIVKALRLIGVIAANEPGKAADLALGLDTLNDMLDSWSTSPTNVVSSTIETFPLVANQASYTIGTGGNFNTVVPVSVEEATFVRYQGVDFPLSSITEDLYAQIPFKINAGIPEAFWYDRDAPLATLYLYPVPAVAMTIEIHSRKPMVAFSGLDVIYELAAGYKEALQNTLAERLASAFEREVPKFVVLEAMRLRRKMKRANVVVPTMDISHVPAPLDNCDNTGRLYS